MNRVRRAALVLDWCAEREYFLMVEDVRARAEDSQVLPPRLPGR